MLVSLGYNTEFKPCYLCKICRWMGTVGLICVQHSASDWNSHMMLQWQWIAREFHLFKYLVVKQMAWVNNNKSYFSFDKVCQLHRSVYQQNNVQAVERTNTEGTIFSFSFSLLYILTFSFSFFVSAYLCRWE